MFGQVFKKVLFLSWFQIKENPKRAIHTRTEHKEKHEQGYASSTEKHLFYQTTDIVVCEADLFTGCGSKIVWPFGRSAIIRQIIYYFYIWMEILIFLNLRQMHLYRGTRVS